MKTSVAGSFLIALVLSAACHAEVKSGAHRLYVIDCGDGSGSDESRWTPGVNTGVPVGFPGHCYLIHHAQGWFLWDTGIDDAVAQLPNHETVFHEWGPGTGPIWRKPITLAAQLEEIHVKPADIKLMAVSHSHPDHAGNIEMFPNALMLVQGVEYEWAGSRQDTVAFNKKHPVKLVDGDHDIFGDGSLVLLSTPGHTPGHQSLYVKLARTGGVVVSGDLYHYVAERKLGKMPPREQTLGTPESRKKVDDFLARTHSQLWLSHTIDWYRDAVKAPGWYD